jgi:hypothetical protein
MRKRLIWVLAACLCVGAADRVLWVVGTRALVNGLDRWEEQARAQGWSVTETGRIVSGWPFTACLAVGDLTLAGGDHAVPGGLQWHAGRAVLSVWLGAPFTLSIKPEGQETVRLSHMKTIVFNADQILAQVPLWHGTDITADLAAQGVTGGLAGSGHPQDVRLESLTLHLRLKNAQGAALAEALAGELDFAAHGLGLPDIGRWPLGDTVAAVAGTVQLSSPNLVGVRGGHDEASAWRDGGGGVLLHDVSMRWGPLNLHAEAKLGLDERLQPAGNGTADVSGAADVLDALVDAKVIAPGIGATGKAVLSVMPPAPNSDALRLPFVLHDNTLSVGPIPLARLNDIIW